jgi:hypothetical protein
MAPACGERLETPTRFVRILLEWDDRRRRTIDAVPAVTERANGDDRSGSLTEAVLCARVSNKDQKRRDS